MDLTLIIARLFSYSSIEATDDIDERLRRSFDTYTQTVSSCNSDSEATDALNNFVARSPEAHEQTCVGLLVSILADPTRSEHHLEKLCLVNRDGMTVVIDTLVHIMLNKFWKLHDSCRSQILWLVRKFVNLRNVNGIDALVFNLLRNIAGGDVSPRNIAFADNMVDLLVDIREWVEKTNFMTPTVVYTLLRLIDDHSSSSAFVTLRQKEIKLTISLLRERFADCMIIGRDLIRLLQNVARIPEFESFWKDLLTSPMSLAPGFTGILQIFKNRTSRRFLQCRLTPDMEKKIVFLTSQIKFGQQKRYQDWFQRQYFSTPESQTLRCDLIRFICGVIHPPNEVLCSDIIPRWAVIGWILTTCTNNIAASNAKLALFYDWLFFDSEKDNIMNIEPAILLMFNSMRNHPFITTSLLDFLCRILPNFHPTLTTEVRRGICTSLQQILEKRVLSSLSPLFEGQRLDVELRALIKQTFPEFCTSSNIIGHNNQMSQGPPAVITISENNLVGYNKVVNVVNVNENNDSNHSTESADARFSDEEDDNLNDKSSKKIVNNNGHSDQNKLRQRDEAPSQTEITRHMDQLSNDLRKQIQSLSHEKDGEVQCEIMERILESITTNDDFDQDLSSSLAVVLTGALYDDFRKKLLPSTHDDESLEESISCPFFVIVRTLSQVSEDDPSRDPLVSLLVDLSNHISCVGYSILYFMRVSKTEDVPAYRDFAKTVAKDVTSCLLRDLRTCQDDDVDLFYFILPFVYEKFESAILSIPQSFLHLTVSSIDASQLQDLVCLILRGDIRMLKKENIVQLINASLDWETFEQNCLWQLILAHNINVENILPVLPKLEYHQHSEALTAILLALRKQEPSADLLKHILGREVKGDDFFSQSILIFWSRTYEEKLAELVSAILNKHSTSPSTKRKRPTAKSSLSSTAEQVLAHLNQLRQNGRVCPSFFYQEVLQSALTSIQSSCNDSQKTKFSDLFALTEDTTEVKSKKKTVVGKKKSTKPTNGSSDSDASEDETSSSNVKVTKTTSNQRKKRKAATNNNSDSD